MDRLKALKVFSSVAHHGSFIRSAEAMNMSKPLTTRAIQDLENLLGVRLLQRTTRRISLTSAGEDVLKRATGLLASFEELVAASSLRSQEVSGAIKVGVATAYGCRRLAAPLAAFSVRHPEVRIHVHTGENDFDLVRDRIDLLVWTGHTIPDFMIARHVGSEPVGLFAAPAYLQRSGTPAHPLDLAGHDGVGPISPARGIGEVRESWLLRRPGESVQAAAPRPYFNASSEETQIAAAVHGVGILRVPCCLVDQEVHAGRLTGVLSEWEQEPLAVHLTYGSRKNQPLAVRALIEHLSISLVRQP